MVFPLSVSDTAVEGLFRRTRPVRGWGGHSGRVLVAPGRAPLHRPEPGAQYLQAADRTPVLDCGHDRNPGPDRLRDRKSTRLNSSHVRISYAVFCLKKKTQYTHDWSTSSAEYKC